MLLFVGDAKIYQPIRGLDDHRKLQSALDKVYDWFSRNSLPLNQGRAVLITLSRKTNPSFFFSNSMSNGLVSMKSEVRDLGVLVDSELLFPKHVEMIVSKARRSSGGMRFGPSLQEYRNLVHVVLCFGEVTFGV